MPEKTDFATKGELVRRMLEHTFEAEVTADEVYGNDGKLRRWLEERRMPYVLALSRSHSLWSLSVEEEGSPCGGGRRRPSPRRGSGE